MPCPLLQALPAALPCENTMRVFWWIEQHVLSPMAIHAHTRQHTRANAQADLVHKWKHEMFFFSFVWIQSRAQLIGTEAHGRGSGLVTCLEEGELHQRLIWTQLAGRDRSARRCVPLICKSMRARPITTSRSRCLRVLSARPEPIEIFHWPFPQSSPPSQPTEGWGNPDSWHSWSPSRLQLRSGSRLRARGGAQRRRGDETRGEYSQISPNSPLNALDWWFKGPDPLVPRPLCSFAPRLRRAKRLPLRSSLSTPLPHSPSSPARALSPSSNRRLYRRCSSNTIKHLCSSPLSGFAWFQCRGSVYWKLLCVTETSIQNSQKIASNLLIRMSFPFVNKQILFTFPKDVYYMSILHERLIHLVLFSQTNVNVKTLPFKHLSLNFSIEGDLYGTRWSPWFTSWGFFSRR